MTNYTIEDFWVPRLKKTNVSTASGHLVQGWSFLDTGLNTFKQAPLTLSEELGGSNDPMRSSILLVSAPGAVGKSTLARQIAFETGSIYIDLAVAEPVGANTLIGGLVRSGISQSYQSTSPALLIDGLDEARLKVTQESFQTFLSEVAERSEHNDVPTVLFGRTVAIQDAWLILADKVPNAAVLEIGYYGPDDAVDFAEAKLRALRPNSPYTAVERTALEMLLQRLRDQTESDENRFAGYAPVLQVVAERVDSESNAGALVAQLEQGSHTDQVTLQNVASAILDREKRKLEGLQFEDESLAGTLYSPKEQLDRLVARVYNLPEPDLPTMNPTDAQTYANALESWVEDHPFIGGFRCYDNNESIVEYQDC